MSKSVDRFVKGLADTDSGWVGRRDAAEGLGRVAQDAIRGLKTYEKDSDQDVKAAVLGSLRDCTQVLAGVDANTTLASAPALEKCVAALEKPGSRDLTKSGDVFSLQVSTTKGRSQTVLIEAKKSNTKRDVICVSTVCAKAEPESYEWALKNNPKMSHCALGVEDREGEATLVLMNNLLADSLSFAELKLTVKEVAYYGDWVEEKFSKDDTH